MANNKVQLADGTVLIDLTADTVTADKLLQGYTAHDASGTQIIGTASGGGGGAVTVVDTPDSHGGTIREITAIVVSGTKSITSNGVQDVTNFASVDVNVPTPAPTLQSKSATPTESSQTISPDAGYDGLSSVSVGAISSTYVGSGVPTKAAATITPGTSNQTIASGTYLTGAQTISGDADLVAGNIKSGVSIFGVTGTYSGGGSSKNVQAYRGYDTVSTTSYTATDITLTVAKTGTYNVSWMGYRNTTSGTSGSQLYKNGTAVGSANTTFVNTYGHSVSLTNQSFNQGDVLVVRARARSTSYVMGVGNLIIEEV